MASSGAPNAIFSASARSAPASRMAYSSPYSEVVSSPAAISFLVPSSESRSAPSTQRRSALGGLGQTVGQLRRAVGGVAETVGSSPAPSASCPDARRWPSPVPSASLSGAVGELARTVVESAEAVGQLAGAGVAPAGAGAS